MYRPRNGGKHLHRRGLLRIGGLSLLGAGLPVGLADVLARESIVGSANGAGQRAGNVILIWLAGGPATIDMWDLKPHAPRSVRGEFEPIATSADGVHICEHLPRMAKQMHQCTLVRSVRHTVAEHGQGTEHVITGNPISPALKYPSIGSLVSKMARAERGVPVYVDLSDLGIGKAGYLSSTHNPFVVEGFGRRGSNGASQFQLPDGFTVTDLRRKSDLLKQIERGFRRFDNTSRADEMSEFQQQAIDILSSGKTRDALDIQREDRKVLERYGLGALGPKALAARRLVQAGVRFVTIGFSGWDTHANNFQQLRNTLLPQLDAALAALLGELEVHGLLEDTIVYCVGEFNRTPIINAQGGRDHWARSMSVLLAGGGFKQGLVYGSTDKHGGEPDSSACSPADINATLLNQLGIAPDISLRTRTGRPVPLFKDGHVIESLTDSGERTGAD